MPMSVRKGYKYDDSTVQAFTAVEVVYRIGTDAYTANNQAFARKNSTEYYRNFLAEEVLLYATEDCYVRFNNAIAVRHPIAKGVWYTVNKRVTKIYVVRQTISGNLTIQSEGNIPMDISLG